MHGDHRLLFAAPGLYERVSRAQVDEVAREIFNPERRTVGVLRPLA
jgi:predicted Zn-dependent peptidase